MTRLKFVCQALGLTTTLLLGSQPGYGLPGQSASVAEAWIRHNPTLSPGPNERLTINRTDTAARRFTFQASLLPVVGVAPVTPGGVIRTERFSLFDLIHGVSAERLEESLRLIYGEPIFDDYRRASLIYQYPNSAATPPPNPDLVLVGDVREGEQYAYWWELASDSQGTTHTGRMVVFLKDDLPVLKAFLEQRDQLSF